MDVYGDFRSGGRYVTQDFDDASNIVNPRLLGLHGYAFFKPDMPQTDEEPAQSLVSSGEAAAAALRASGYVDADCIGVIGQSYGGYTTLCLLTRSQMFKAGIVANGIYDLVRIATGYSEAWYVEGGQGRMRARLWDDPLRYIVNSPLYALHRLETPLLILQGGGDSLTSNQSPPVFNALMHLGKPAEMVVAANMGHVPTHWSAEVQRDLIPILIGFLDKHLKIT